MQLLSVASVAVLAIVGLAVGVRLLVLARRNRAWPEALIGIALSTMPLGFGFIVGGIALAPKSPPGGLFLMCTGSLILNLGGVAPAIFTHRVFRPESRAARLACLMIFGSAMFSWIGNGLGMGYRFDLESGTFSVLAGLTRATALSWAAIESFIYWRTMQRRLSLGLTDAIVTNRFALWTIGTGLGGVSVVAALVSELLGGGAAASAPIQLLISLAGLGASAAFVLAFIPPASYQRWVASRAH